MNHLSFLIAQRYVRDSQGEKHIGTMMKICFSGIAIGTFALTLILCIMNGFEKTTHEKLQGIHAHFIMRSHGDSLNSPEIVATLAQEFPEIAAVSPVGMQQALITTPDSDITTVIMIKGIDPEAESRLNNFEKKIVNPITHTQNLASLLTTHHVLIGSGLASLLEVNVGDEVTILYSENNDTKTNKINFHEQTAVVSGIFTTGIDEFDSNLLIGALPFFNHIFPETGITHINMNLKKGSDENRTLEKLRTRFGLEIYSWKDLYPALVATLKLEKYAMFFILMLIVLVASMSMISLLFMHIVHKQRDIAILKSMGCSDASISSIFIMLGMMISLAGSVTGLLCAAAAGYLLERYPFIQLPDAYYTTHLPVAMSWEIFLTVFCTAMILGFFASWIPTRKISAITIAHVIRSHA